MRVAVVVPVYNVEDYIDNCIKSLIDQTTDNYRVYLIDDGSTDNSGRICDKYAEEYEFISVYHKKNGGLADARNFGVECAQEEYVTFVDSDDTIRNDYIEKLSYAICTGNVDVAISNYIPVSESFVRQPGNREKIYTIENNRDFLQSAILGKKGSLSSCAKMYKKAILLKFPFPKGKLYEDMEVVFSIISYVKKVAYINENLYFYLTRENSIVQSKVTERHKFGIQSCIHMLDVVDADSRNLNEYIKCRVVMQACGHLPNLVKYHDEKMFCDISDMIKPYLKEVLFGRTAPAKLRIRAFSYCLPSKVGLFFASGLFGLKKAIRK